MSSEGAAAPSTRLVFPVAVEGVIKGLGERVTPAALEKLRAGGLDVSNLPPAIPAEDMPRHLRTLAAEIWPEESPDEQLRLMGLTFVRGWQNTFLGAAMSALLRVVGPQRTLQRMDRAFRTSDNFTHGTVVKLAETEFLVTISDVNDMPTYWRGVLQASLEFLGLVGTVELQAYPRPQAEYLIRW
jgi:uncharacterized protein (TIGR02265 family)